MVPAPFIVARTFQAFARPNDRTLSASPLGYRSAQDDEKTTAALSAEVLIPDSVEEGNAATGNGPRRVLHTASGGWARRKTWTGDVGLGGHFKRPAFHAQPARPQRGWQTDPGGVYGVRSCRGHGAKKKRVLGLGQGRRWLCHCLGNFRSLMKKWCVENQRITGVCRRPEKSSTASIPRGHRGKLRCFFIQITPRQRMPFRGSFFSTVAGLRILDDRVSEGRVGSFDDM